jgi:hypothetical protein
MIENIRWSGTAREAAELTNAIARNCTCTYAPTGARVTTCEPHTMLIRDQRALDGLLFFRRIADRLRREEHALGLG